MTKYVELNTFLKIKGFASTGGNAKNIIRDEKIKVNSQIETRSKRKLHEGDKVSFNGKDYIVEQSVCLKTDEKND